MSRASRRLRLIAAALALAASGCDASIDAPTNPKVCWRLSSRGGAKDFQLLASGVANLESCAARLEALSMQERRGEVTGAYQGQFIFITPDMIQSALRLEGARYRVFDAAARAKLDRALRWRLDDEARPSAFAPPKARRP